MDNIFNQSFGDNLAKVLSRAQFKPAGTDDPYATHRFYEEVTICYPLKDQKEIDTALSRYMEYFEEVINKVHDQAAHLVPGIYITHDMVEDAVHRLRVLLEKAITGNPEYLPYMHEYPIPSFKEAKKGFLIGINMWISRPTEEDADPILFWMVKAQAWEFNPERSSITRFQPIEVNSAVRDILIEKSKS